MRAVVLVGGEGTRLRPLTYTTPKQLLPVVEVAMLERVVGQLARYGVDEAVLSMAYRPDAFRRAYPGDEADAVRLSYATEPEPLDTAGAIRYAATLAGIDDTFVAVNGDVLTDLDLGELIAFHTSRRAWASIHLTAVEDPSRFGIVPTDDQGRVRAFIEKPAPGEASTNLINAGTYVLEPAVLERIPAGRRVSIERETFPALAAEGKVYALASDAYWLDTGTPEAYLQANRDLLQGRRGVPAPGARCLADGVWTLGDPVLHGAIEPCSLLGDGCCVERGASVRASVIGAESVVCDGALVEDSVLLPGTRVETGARVSGSIIGRNAVVEAGCTLEALSVVGDDTVVTQGRRLVGARVPAQSP